MMLLAAAAPCRNGHVLARASSHPDCRSLLVGQLPPAARSEARNLPDKENSFFFRSLILKLFRSITVDSLISDLENGHCHRRVVEKPINFLFAVLPSE